MNGKTWLLLLVVACGRPVEEQPPPGNAQNPDPLTNARSYTEAQGFVVHEWGTLTSVIASDGSLLPGLHHEEEDLPGFVADRMAQAKTTPSLVEHVPFDGKMETPVTYFYSPKPLDVVARVDFPSGILTQWFPWVQAMSPPLYVWNETQQPVDAWLSASESIPPSCAYRFDGPLKGGMLDWGPFKVLGRGEQAELAGPLGKTSWGFARNVASNTLAVGDQREKFLFYRGLANLDLPLKTTLAGNTVKFSNPLGQQKIGALFVIQVTATGAGFVELGPLAGGDAASVEIPAASQSLLEYGQALRKRLQAVLAADGLYDDEALAMVDTWQRGYFFTPGVRALYLLPQAVTDEILPLHISPAPKVQKRTMVIRQELLTPAHEAELSLWLSELATSWGWAPSRNHFLALGRFAEPHLTWAVRNSKSADEQAAGNRLLTEIRQQQKWAPTAAQ